MDDFEEICRHRRKSMLAALALGFPPHKERGDALARTKSDAQSKWNKYYPNGVENRPDDSVPPLQWFDRNIVDSINQQLINGSVPQSDTEMAHIAYRYLLDVGELEVTALKKAREKNINPPEDAAQMAMVHLEEQITNSKYIQQEKVKIFPGMIKIMANKLEDIRRHEKNNTNTLSLDEIMANLPGTVPQVTDPKSNPAKALEDKETLQNILADLTKKERFVLEKDAEEMSAKEGAEAYKEAFGETITPQRWAALLRQARASAKGVFARQENQN